MKKLIALLLCLAMLLSLASVAMAIRTPMSVLAKAKYISSTAIQMKKQVSARIFSAVDRYINGINYVALGDSTSMGFHVGDDPVFSYSYQHNTGADGKENASSEYSEYTMFLNYLQELYPGVSVVGTDLTLPGMRPIQLRGILNECEHNRLMARTGEIEDTHYKEHMDAYMNSESSYSNKAANAYNGYDDIHSTYTTKLRAADVITYDMLMIDSTANLVQKLLPAAKNPTPSNKFATLMQAEGYIKTAFETTALKAALKSILSQSDLPLVTINNILDYLLYTYATITINFSKNINWLYWNNRNATLLVLGPTNYLSGITVDINGATLNIGRLWDCLIDAITSYLVNGDPHADWYHLVDCSQANEICIGAAAKGLIFTDDDYKEFCSYIIDKYDLDTKVGSENFAKLNENLANACYNFLNTPLSLNSLAGAMGGASGGADMKNALYTGINKVIDGKNYYSVIPSSDDMTALTIGWMLQLTGFGFHPSVEGCKQKLESLKVAYLSCSTADEFYSTRMANFALNTVGAVLGNEKSQSFVSAAITKIRTPIVDLSGLKKAQ